MSIQTSVKRVRLPHGVECVDAPLDDLIIQALKRHGWLSQMDLVRVTGLNRKTVARHVHALREGGVLRARRVLRRKRGRGGWGSYCIEYSLA